MEVTSDPRFTRVTFTPAVAPDPAGLTFAGVFQASAGGESNHLFTPIGYPPLPREYEHALPLCDHTGRTLRRQTFYVLRKPDGTWVQVAQQWLADYLGDNVAASLLVWWVEQYHKLLLTIRDSMPHAGREHFSVTEVLQVAVAVIQLRGWVSRGQAHKHGDTATASLVLDLLEYGKTQPNKELQRLSDEIDAMAEGSDGGAYYVNEIVQWLKDLHADEVKDHKLTDYLHNLALVASQEYVEARHVGVLCSAPGAYEDWLKVQAVEALTPVVDPGKHLGMPGTRMEAKVFVDQIENRGENEYGVSLLVHMHVVPTGERLKWWTGEGLTLDEGREYNLRMSIKKHGEWDGRKETTVSHCRDIDAPVKPRKPRKSREGEEEVTRDNG